MELEHTPLYRLVTMATEKSLTMALTTLDGMSDDDVRVRSTRDKSTHCGTVVPLVPLIYRLSLRGLNVNAQNEHGNTALHLALLRPHATALCPHLIRIGVDPCIQNKKQCRIVHTYRNHVCQMIKEKGTAVSGIWKAVDREDVALCEKLLKTWCRVNIKRNKTLQQVADETGNITIIRMLKKYYYTNEVACAAFACDEQRLKDAIRHGGMKVDYDQKDESIDIPKPLIVCLQELGDVTENVISIIREHHSNGLEDYEREKVKFESGYEESDFYLYVTEGSEQSLHKALELLHFGEVNVKLTSFQPETKGWTYLHMVVDRYGRLVREDEERARLLIRALYRLALAGVDVNTRAADGATALHKASENLDQNLMTHVIRIGGDPSLCTTDGRAVNEEKYRDRGKLVFDKHYRQADLPGLWAAVDLGDAEKTERWLKSWCRVNIRRGDRRMIDVVRSKGPEPVLKLLEQYEHINEFICATFACNLKQMMDLIALGKGKHKVNSIDDFFHVGFTWDRHAEFMQRPVIVAAFELCTSEVVDFLLRFGADLSKQHEECAPCGPVAHWAFRDHINNDNALMVAQHVDVALRDEQGATVLHRAVQKQRGDHKLQIIETLLARGADLAARDDRGSTARDYTFIHDLPDGDVIRQVIDNHILEEVVCNDQHYQLETLMLDGYDHILDIRGTKKNKTARDLAHLKEFKEVIALLDDLEHYRAQIDLLHEAAVKGDLMTISKLSGEKRCAWGRDLAGRTLLHNAVLYEHPELCRFLTEQYPNLTNSTDSLGRTPLHYCVTLKERQRIWPILQDAGADPNLIDGNNMSVYDYVRELETPTARKEKSRGRRWQDYRPENLIATERERQYGAQAQVHALKHRLLPMLKQEGLGDVKRALQAVRAPLSTDDVDLALLRECLLYKRQEIAKYLVEQHGCRSDVELTLITADEKEHRGTVEELADELNLSELHKYFENKKTDAQIIADVPAETDTA